MEAGGPGSVQRNNGNVLRRFVFTLNNYTVDEYDALCSFGSTCSWFIMGIEKGASGTPHLQGEIVVSGF